MTAPPALRLHHVHVRRGTVAALRGVDLVVGAGERWAVLGPNGSGKTTLVQLAAGYLHPTRGTVDVLGQRLGRVDVRRLRERIGLVSGALTRTVEPSLVAADVVLSGRHGALEPWWHDHGPGDRAEARRLLAAAGLAGAAGRPFAVLSEGERQQVLLARALMARAELLVLDEPAAGLDVAGRERLAARLTELAADPGSPTTVLVTHHVEEIPAGFDHLLLLREGRVVAAGPLAETLTAGALSEAFDLDLELAEQDGRWTCRARALRPGG
ncbi:MAG TPA: ATP-binding cassette domain-containing protein [Acidimicrobiales bacterium]|nr:ATP-binding cassette domain-containing protein [Acidimicrobiales bacterium]